MSVKYTRLCNFNTFLGFSWADERRLQSQPLLQVQNIPATLLEDLKKERPEANDDA